jgi:hypothetical protein
LTARPFSWPITITGPAVETRHTADDGLVVAEVAIAMQLVELGEDARDVIQGVGAQRVPRHLDHLPGREVGEDLLREPRALRTQFAELLRQVEFRVGTDQLQLLDLDLELGDRLFKVQVVRIHGLVGGSIGSPRV